MSGTTMTANQIITLALKDSGAFGDGQTPTATDLADGLQRLNMMLAQWQRKRWLVWHTVDNAILSQGKQSYSVGPGGDISIPRPDRLEFAYIRQMGTQQVNPNYPTGGQQYFSGTGNPSTSNISPGTCVLWLNTTTNIMAIWCNVNGTLIEGSALGIFQ